MSRLECRRQHRRDGAASLSLRRTDLGEGVSPPPREVGEMAQGTQVDGDRNSNPKPEHVTLTQSM